MCPACGYDQSRQGLSEGGNPKLIAMVRKWYIRGSVRSGSSLGPEGGGLKGALNDKTLHIQSMEANKSVPKVNNSFLEYEFFN